MPVPDIPIRCRFHRNWSDWITNVQILEQHFDAHDFPEKLKKAALLELLDEYDYIQLRDLCYPIKLMDKTYDELFKIIYDFFVPKTSVFRKRHTFYNAQQEPNETVNDWFNRIRRLASECRFGDRFESVRLNRFISGLRPSEVLDRLFEEDIEALTMESALEIAAAKESVTRDNFVEGVDHEETKTERRARKKRQRRNKKKKQWSNLLVFPVNMYEILLALIFPRGSIYSMSAIRFK